MPAFYTPPPGLPLADLADRIARRVVDLYGDIEAELTGAIAARIARGLPADPTLSEQLYVLRELETRATELIGRVPPDLAAQIVQLAAERGIRSVPDALGLANDMPLQGFSRSQAETVGMVATDLDNAFREVALRILRYPIDALGVYIGTDIYQQTIARSLGLRTLRNLPVEQVRRLAVTDFLEKGITGFTDRRGRRWSIGSYTEMAVRTGSARAYTEASTARMLRNGTGLVDILGNNDACPMCAPWFGKVLSIDGTPAGTYEMQHATEDDVAVTVVVAATLDDARRQGLMHPNCACRPRSYLPGVSTPTAVQHHDRQAWEASQAQRGLERRIRDAKRKLEVAQAFGDEGKVAKQKARIRDSQAGIRAILDDFGRHRRPEREQARFDNGGA